MYNCPCNTSQVNPRFQIQPSHWLKLQFHPLSRHWLKPSVTKGWSPIRKITEEVICKEDFTAALYSYHIALQHFKKLQFHPLSRHWLKPSVTKGWSPIRKITEEVICKEDFTAALYSYHIALQHFKNLL